MKLPKKMTFSSKKPTSSEAAAVEATDPALNIPREVLGPNAPMATIRDDECTIFTTFMTCYFGFYAVVCLAYPKLFVIMPYMPYWTELTDSECFIFRLFGIIALTFVFGPYMDETFGGSGVRMAAFTRQLGIANLLLFFLFVYYTFYAPLATAVVLTWQVQCVISTILLGWSITECITVETLVSFYAKANVSMYTFFGVALVAAPSDIFGTPSPLAYWSAWGPLAVLSARGLGIGLLSFVATGYYYSGAKMCKAFTVFNIINVGLFTMPAFFPGESAVDDMWQIQILISVILIIVGVYLEIIGATGPWKISPPIAWPSQPSTEQPIEIFNFVSFYFFVPFVLGFYYDPSMVPLAPLGFPMFVEEFNETSTWFSRAWATNVLMLMLGQYFLGLEPLPITKMYFIHNFGAVVLFIYGIFFTSMMNFVVAVGLLATQVVFVIWGGYVILPTKGYAPLLA